MTGTRKSGSTKEGDGGPEGRMSSDILSNHVETDRRLLEGVRSAAAFRGDVAFASPAPAFDAELYMRAEEVCAPGAIAVEGAGPTIDRGKCIMCGMC